MTERVGSSLTLAEAEKLVDELRYYPESRERRDDVLRLIGDLIAACSRLRPVAFATEHDALVSAVTDIFKQRDALCGALREIRALLGPLVPDERVDYLLRTFAPDRETP